VSDATLARDPSMPTWFYTLPHKPIDIVPWIVLSHEGIARMVGPARTEQTKPADTGAKRSHTKTKVKGLDGTITEFPSRHQALNSLGRKQSGGVRTSITRFGYYVFCDGTKVWLSSCSEPEDRRVALRGVK